MQAIVPMLPKIPERYHPIFRDGRSKAMTDAMSARFGRAFNYDFQVELYRGVAISAFIVWLQCCAAPIRAG